MLHARTVRGREGDLEQLYESLIARCRGLGEALDGAPRITPVHSAANFSYRTDPAVGDRFVCVGDAIAFVDPIFSSGVYIATQSAELSSVEILKAFRENRFEARRFRGYERRIRHGHEALPALHPALLRSLVRRDVPQAARVRRHGRQRHRGARRRRLPPSPLRMRISLEVFFTIVRINRWVRRRRGLTTESRLEW